MGTIKTSVDVEIDVEDVLEQLDDDDLIAELEARESDRHNDWQVWIAEAIVECRRGNMKDAIILMERMLNDRGQSELVRAESYRKFQAAK